MGDVLGFWDQVSEYEPKNKNIIVVLRCGAYEVAFQPRVRYRRNDSSSLPSSTEEARAAIVEELGREIADHLPDLVHRLTKKVLKLRLIDVVEVQNPGTSNPVTGVVRVVHNESDLTGKDYVAVVAGDLCPEGDCRWCNDLRMRCQSRRMA